MSKGIIYKRLTTVRAVGWNSELVTYEVELDFDDLAGMARTAARSKGQKCRDGALVVRVIKRQQLSPSGPSSAPSELGTLEVAELPNPAAADGTSTVPQTDYFGGAR